MTTKIRGSDVEQTLFGNLLDERLLHYRRTDTGERVATTLPDLFLAMAQNQVRDFPALRPHQRHPWHAFLVQLAAIALHRSERAEPFATADEWRAALLALTPDDPDGAAWCLVSPVNRPAFMQAAEPSRSINSWKNCLVAADELDMLVTSKNHDLKAARMSHSTPEEWFYALISLQTQEGFLGAGNYGTSRMNGGFASRCGVGVHPRGSWGARWCRDLFAVARTRDELVESFGFSSVNGYALVWLISWDGSDSLSFASLDPWYIEICRRVRLINTADKLNAFVTGSKAPRIAAKELNGITGDPWMPVDGAASKALTIGSRGFDYKLATELLLGKKFTKPTAQIWLPSDDTEGVYLLAQGVARGQGKTEGYHERCIPVSRTVRKAFLTQSTDELAKLANDRIAAIAEVRKMLWTALTVLFGNGARGESGKDKDASDAVKDRASLFVQPFEAQCDAQFFPELIEEIEAEDREMVRHEWLLTLADRAKSVLQSAFTAGPRSGQLRYRAQSAALGRLRSMMHGNKLPALAHALKSNQQTISTSPEEETHDHA
jgi:CRISPR system Cascade subunit CasA